MSLVQVKLFSSPISVLHVHVCICPENDYFGINKLFDRGGSGELLTMFSYIEKIN